MMLVCLVSGTIAVHAQFISTYAGTDTAGYSGDTGYATAARMHSPYGVALDNLGNVYITDYVNNCIRKVTAATGVINTIAGQQFGQTAGYTGDGKKAINAKLNGPTSIGVDGTGNVYFVDYNNNVIRCIRTNDTIYTVAGIFDTATTSPGYGPKYGYNGDGRQARTALLNKPSIAVDNAGNIFIADKYNFRIRKITAATGMISTIGGTGVGGYSGDGGAAGGAQMCPHAVAVTSEGYIYFTDSVSSVYRVIRMINGAGQVSHFRSSWAEALGADRSGGIYFSDASCYVRKGYSPQRMAIIGGNGDCIHSGDGGKATEAGIDRPMGIAFDSARHAYVAEMGGHRVRKILYDPAAVAEAGTITADVKVMPNPASETFVFEMPYADDQVSIVIADMAGRIVTSKTVQPAVSGVKETIDVRGYTPGMYIIRATCGDQVFHAKVSVR